jgi:PAS domain-containing protein
VGRAGGSSGERNPRRTYERTLPGAGGDASDAGIEHRGDSGHFETIRIAKDGRRLNISITVSPIKDSGGHVIGASKVARNITERKNAEDREQILLAEAATANAKFRAFFEQGPLFAGIMALDGTIIEANRLRSKVADTRRSRWWESHFGSVLGGTSRRH